MRGIRRLAVSGGAAVLLTLGAAAPAYATPPNDPVVTSPTGTLDAASTQVVATMQFNDGAPTAPARLRLEKPGGGVSTSSVAAGPTMRFPVTLDLNGTYTAQVAVDWREDRFLTADLTGTATSAKRSFKVAVPAATPAGVATSVDAASRTVTVTWEKNPEPDMRRYEVRRSHNGGDFATVGTVDHPEAKFVDASTAGTGGEYRYVVVAYRAGVDANVASQVGSDPSATTKASTAAVPDPPPPPTTAPPATAPPAAPPGTPSPTAAPGAGSTPASTPGAVATSGKVDLSGFNNVQANTPRPATPRTVPLPDPGFQSTLPFDVPEDAEAEEPEAGDTGELAADSPELRELGEEDDGNRQRSLALFAGGLLATVLLMHVLWVKGEVKRVPLEALPPEGPPPGAADAGRARRARAAKAKPVKAGRTGSPEWFVPELGVDDGADRAAAERKAS